MYPHWNVHKSIGNCVIPLDPWYIIMVLKVIKGLFLKSLKLWVL